MTGGTRQATAPRQATATGRGSRRPSAADRSPSRWLRRRLPRPGLRALAGVLAVLVVAAGAWLWLRTSSLVAVRQVTITGVSGPDAARIRRALSTAAHGMTTLDVRMAALQSAIRPYPVVKHLQVSTSFPHAMRIHVVEQVPVAEITAAGQQESVSADGTILHDAAATGPLPTIALAVPPGGTHLQGVARSETELLAAAPYAVLAKVATVSSDSSHDLVVALRQGPKIYFGDASRLSAKWSAALAVLAASSSDGAAYIDVSDPSRPAAGAGADAGSSASGAL